MNTRLAAIAALGREVALPTTVLAWIIASGFTGIDHSGAAPITGGLAQSLTADANFADKMPPALRTAAMVAVSSPVTEPATTDVMPALPEPESAVTAALTDPWETPPPSEAASEPETKLTVATAEPGDIAPRVGSTEASDQCAVVDSCVDRLPLGALPTRAQGGRGQGRTSSDR